MNEFTFEQISESFKKGEILEQSFSVSVTAQMMERFLAITGDENPMHVNTEYAKENGFKDSLVYGLLTTSFYSTLAGVYLPGKNCLLQEVSAQFTKPVFVGDKLTVSGKVVEVHETFKRIVIKARIVNQDGNTVNRATIKAGVLK